MSSDIPFYANTPDGTHCFQAALRMVIGFFEPTRELSWQVLDDMTAKQAGMWTWTMAGLMWLQQQGYQVKNIENFDYARFARDKDAYLIHKFGPAVAGEQIRHSDIQAEAALAQRFIHQVHMEQRLPEIEEIEKLLQQGYLCIANINSRILGGREGYVGHFVVLTGTGPDTVTFHDPGLPPLKDRCIRNELFIKAWAYPDNGAKNFIAIKKS